MIGAEGDFAANQIEQGAGKNSTRKSLLIDGLFEGDLAISEDFICKS